MGKSDVILKQWLKNKVRFADLFNAVVFDGEQVIKPEELEELNSESGIVIENAADANDTEEKYFTEEKDNAEEENNRKEKHKKNRTDNRVRYQTEHRYRDLVMRWKGEAELAVLALENQLSEEEKRSVNENEFFSRFRKNEKLCPVITIIFYYGEEKWDGAVQLYELFGVEDEKLVHILQRYVPNYRMNLIEANSMEDVRKYKSDLQILFDMLRYRKDKRRLLEYTKEHSECFKNLDYESLQAMAVLLNTDKLLAKVIEKKGVDGNMCQALEEYYQDGVQEGIEKGILQGMEKGIAQGLKQGIEKGIEQERKNIVINMLKKGFAIELIAELASLSVADVRKICSEM